MRKTKVAKKARSMRKADSLQLAGLLADFSL